MARSRYKFRQNNDPYFLTATVVGWQALFNDESMAMIVVDSLNFLVSRNRICLYGYVIMPTHMHLIAHAENLSKRMQQFKSYTALS